MKHTSYKLRTLVLGLIGGLLFSVASCRSSRKEPASGPAAERNITKNKLSEPPSLMFDIVPATGLVAGGVQRYQCTYEAQGKTARFRVEISEGATSHEQFPITSIDGKFVADKDSDDSVLLEDLKKILQAPRPALRSRKVSELLFNGVILGRNYGRDATSGYNAEPAGNWTVMKIFLPKGGDDGEVFLNINRIDGKGEFSIKDSDYGDYVLNALAKVL
jgi:hypothetical protein